MYIPHASVNHCSKSLFAKKDIKIVYKTKGTTIDFAYATSR